MPSLRAVPRNFMTDWGKIAEKLQLSRSSIVNMCKQAQHELHSATTLFVAHWLERIHDTRASIESMTKSWQELQHNPDPEDPWYGERELKLDEFLLRSGFIKEWELGCRGLPSLYNRETWLEWFERGFKPYVDNGPALSHIQGTRLHGEILKAVGERTGDGTYAAKDYVVRDELKRRCKPKFKSLAPSVEYSQETSQLACRARYRLTDTPYDRIPR
ncbi:MAG: hypothetical protein NT105_11485 [Verrucomicrobia bacterium]|nr:hypothetical protein [Verrucomicrobiota bacterium]